MIKRFIEEVWAFYGPEGIYPKYFNGALTKEQVEEAVILVYDYFRNHDIEFDEGSYERDVVFDVMIQMHVYDGLPPGTIEYVLGLDPYAEFINDIVKWAY
jgi:hypothetical protein